MSTAIRCDNCGTFVPPDADEALDWLRVQWGVGRGFSMSADYCTAACAVVGIEAARDDDARSRLAALDEDDEDDQP